MGWFHDLGNKVKGEVHSLGNKIHNAGQKAAKFVHKVAPVIKDVASTISKDAGMVGSIAESALPLVAEVPIVGEVVGGIAGAAELVGGAAGGVAGLAGRADSLAQDVSSGKAIERAKAGVKKEATDAFIGLATQGARTGNRATGADVKKSAKSIGSGAFNRFVGTR